MTAPSYEALLCKIATKGHHKQDRTGTGTRSLFGERLSYNLNAGFPLLTTKRVPFKSIVAELLWFLSGSTNVADLQKMGCTIWDEWAREDGDLGPIYGKQWRSWTATDGRHIDQISNVLRTIKTYPDSRRMVVSAWNVADLDSMALMPCHAMFQFYVAPAQAAGQRKRLSCQVYQRSADIFLGVPFNIASYALLTHMVAQQCDLDVGDLIWVGGDCHLYDNHTTQAIELLSRTPRPFPALRINNEPPSLFEYELSDFELIGYNPHPAIKAPVAV